MVHNSTVGPAASIGGYPQLPPNTPLCSRARRGHVRVGRGAEHEKRGRRDERREARLLVKRESERTVTWMQPAAATTESPPSAQSPAMQRTAGGEMSRRQRRAEKARGRCRRASRTHESCVPRLHDAFRRTDPGSLPTRTHSFSASALLRHRWRIVKTHRASRKQRLLTYTDNRSHAQRRSKHTHTYTHARNTGRGPSREARLNSV